jgi:hypothetical protein
MKQRLADAEARARNAETQRDSLARALLYELGKRTMNAAAAQAHPNDLYAQTVMVMGFDPLTERARSLTAERFDHD